MPGSFTVIVRAESPVLHFQSSRSGGTLRITLSPAQSETSPAGTMGISKTVSARTVTGAETPLHPCAVLTLTVYKPEVRTIRESAGSPPGCQRYDANPFGA